MVNLKKLNQSIIQSGVKKEYIAKELGITSQALYNKLKGKVEFKVSEVYNISKILRLTQEDITSIFFTQNVEFKSTKNGEE